MEYSLRGVYDMNHVLAVLLVVVAVGVLFWGFERYRTQFVKTDLLLAFGVAAGLLVMVFAPTVYDRIGNMLSLRQRVITISLLTNGALLFCVLYLVSHVRSNRGSISELTRNLSIDEIDPIRADGGEDTIGIIIPAYNEAGTIRSVVESLPAAVRGYAVVPIVVSDGSGDETAEKAKINGVTVIEHPLNQGQGGALKTGFEVAARWDMSIVATMDGDGQHPVDGLEQLVTPIIDDEADYVMGSRHKGSDFSENSMARRAGIRTFTWIINTLTKAEITDCTNGFRAIRGTELDKLILTEERFSAPELIIEARKNGLRIEEIPITIEKRVAGETKKPQLGYAIGLTRTILVTWLR